MCVSQFPRHAKRVADGAVKRAYATLEEPCRAAFTELLQAVRTRTTVEICPRLVAALRNIARFADHYVRALDEWPGVEGTVYPVVHALSQHLLARHPVPRFLASAWHDDGAIGDDKRRWFIAHAAGTRFRDLELPAPMTRQMESIFLRSPDHLSVEAAMRRAEILALGGNAPLVAAVLATRLGRDVANGRFWRTVMEFFVRFAERIGPHAVGPIVDFLQFVRHERVEALTPSGSRFIEPPEPAFSIKGRSPVSLQRLVEAWHRRLGSRPADTISWRRSGLQPMTFEEPSFDPEKPPLRWEIVELTCGSELSREGRQLQHCVATYAPRCLWGQSRIWSLRRVTASSNVRAVTTVEVDPRARAIVQARGLRNRVPSARERALLALWARRENLTLRV